MTTRHLAASICLLTALASLLIETKAQALYDFIFPIETDHIPTSRPVVFDCQLENKWSKDTHPIDFPIHHDPHLGSPLIVSHAKEYNIWNAGLFASPGIKQMAEMGKTEILKQEFHNSELTKDFVQGNRTQKTHQDESDVQIIKDLQVQLDAKHSCISTITKIIPSPDWFTGFQDFQPINYTSNTWFDGFTINTYPIDAGTKSGNSYLRNGSATTETIFQYTEATVPDTFVFLDQFGSSVPPVAEWSCVRQDLGRTSQSSANLRSGSEYRSTIPRNINDGEVLSNLLVSTPVEYSVTFSGTWTANNHPNDYPSSAQFSPHLLLSHSDEFQLWTPGELASEAVTKMAQDADGSGIVQIINNDAGQNLKDATIGSGATGASISDQLVGTISLDSVFDTISAIATLVPSPDWFTGFSSVKPIENGYWLRQFSIEAMPWDAGTKSGTTYEQTGDSLASPDVISQITSDFNAIFTAGVGTTVAPFGQYNFELLTEETTSMPAVSPPTASPTVPIGTTAPSIPVTTMTTGPTTFMDTPAPTITDSTTVPSPQQEPSTSSPDFQPITRSPIISIQQPSAPSLSPTILQTTAKPIEKASESPSSQPTREPRLIVATASYDITDSFIEDYIPLWQPISYNCQFRNKWTANRHPKDYPINASWSKPFLISHSLNYDLWKIGDLASSSIQQLLKYSDASALEEGLSNALSMPLSSVGDFRVGSHQTLYDTSSQSIEDIKINKKHPFLTTLVGMSPSPDWFSGLLKFSPTSNETWLDEFTLETYPWDAGIDSGITYTSPSAPSDPLQVIYRLSNTTVPNSMVLLDPMEENVLSVASWQCVRQQDEFLPYKDRPSKRIPVDKTVIEDDFEISDIEVTAEAAEVEYSVTFNNSWTAENHPFDFPSDSRLTPHVFVSHNSDFELWRPGMLASDVVKKLAEEGDETGLYNLIGEAGAALLDGARGTENIGTLRFDSDRRYVTSLSKIDPSPDWFTGITNIEPVRDGRWLKRFTVFVLPFDAGTDGGNNYASSNSPQVPPNVITRITRSSLPRDSPVFVNSGVSNLVHPLGKFDFVLLNAPSPTASTMPSQYLSTAPSIVVSLINSPTSPPVETAPTNSPVGSSLPTEVPTSPTNPVVFSLSPTVKVGQPTASPNAPIQSSITPTIPLSGPTNTGGFSQSPTIKLEPTTSAPAPSSAIPTIDSGFSLSPTQKNTPPPTQSPSKAPVLPPLTPSPTIGTQPPVASPPTQVPNTGGFSQSPSIKFEPTTSAPAPSLAIPTIDSGFSLSPTQKNTPPPTRSPSKAPVPPPPPPPPTPSPTIGTQPTVVTLNPTLLPSRIVIFPPFSIVNPSSPTPAPSTPSPTIGTQPTAATLKPTFLPSRIVTLPPFSTANPSSPPTTLKPVIIVPENLSPSAPSEELFVNFNFWDFWKPKPYADEPASDPQLADSNVPTAPPTTRASTNPSRQPLPPPPYVSYLSNGDDDVFEEALDRGPDFYGIDVTLSQNNDDDLFIDTDALDPQFYSSNFLKTSNDLDLSGENSNVDAETDVSCKKPSDSNLCIEVYDPKYCKGCRYNNICQALSAGYNYEECIDFEELSPDRSSPLLDKTPQNRQSGDMTKNDNSQIVTLEVSELDPISSPVQLQPSKHPMGSGVGHQISSGEGQIETLISIGCTVTGILITW